MPLFVLVFFLLGAFFVVPQKFLSAEKVYEFIEHPFVRDLGYNLAQARNSVIKTDSIIHFPYWFHGANLPELSLIIDAQDLKTMEEALPDKRFSSGLAQENKKFVSAQFGATDYTEKVSIRYRGGNGGHWNNSKRSLLVKFPKEHLFQGMKSIDLVSPQDRAYLIEVLNLERLKRVDLSHRRMFFVRLRVNNKDAGVYLAKERFSAAWLELNAFSDASEIFSQSNNGVFGKWRKDIREEDPSYGALETLFLLHKEENPEIRTKLIRHIVDLPKWYRAMAINVLTGSPHSMSTNLILLFNATTGTFEPLLEDMHIYSADTNPQESVYDVFDDPLSRYVLQTPSLYKEYQVVLEEMSSNVNLEKDLAYYDELTDALLPEFYKDQTKNRSDRFVENRIKTIREWISDNYTRAQYLATRADPPLPTQKTDATLGNVEFPESFTYLYDTILSSQQFIEAHPEFRTQNGNIVLPSGTYTFRKNIIIPNNTKLILEPGTKIYMAKDTSLISYSPVHAVGDEQSPILFARVRSEENWGVIAIINAEDSSEFRHVTMVGGSSSDIINGITFTGMLSAHNSPVKITYSNFYKDADDDAINIKNSTGEISYSSFGDNKGDAIDIDAADSFNISNNTFKNIGTGNIGGDAIDISFSSAYIARNVVTTCQDKGISIGEKSTPVIENNYIGGCDIGIAVKDKSRAEIRENEIVDNNIGLALYQKKQVFGGAQATIKNNIIQNNKESISVDENSQLIEKHD